jgi:hypothetical protein
MTRDEKVRDVAAAHGVDPVVLAACVDDLAELGVVKLLPESTGLRITIGEPPVVPGMCAGFPPPPSDGWRS